jgi:minimal CRISPR polymerase domain
MSGEAEVFVLGDGDKIRQRVESLLLSGELAALRCLSVSITSAIAQLAHTAKAAMDAEVIVAGGDDLVLRVPKESFDQNTLASMAAFFMEQTGCGMSFGVGPDLDTAYLNLRRAKARGGATTVGI